MSDQMMFDLDVLIREADFAAAPAWNGAPLRYHEDHYSPRDLDAALERWILEHGHGGCIPDSHMWNRYMFGPKQMPPLDHHVFELYAAETSCRLAGHDHHSVKLPGNTRYQAFCEPCGWRVLGDSDSAVIEAWHDHAIPGWRQLPVVPRKVQGIPQRGRNPLQEWVEEHYPLEAQQPGHPIVSARGGFGTRHVPGRSPWGGYDLSDSAL